MRNQGQLIFGGLLVFLGAVLLFGTLFQINVWAICWPAALVLLGVYLLVRPNLSMSGVGVNFHPFGDVKRRGDWAVTNEEIWMFIGDVDLDLTRAEVPAGDTVIRIFGFITDVDLIVPPEVGLAVSSLAFVTDSKILGSKGDSFLAPVSYTSPGYDQAERRVRLESFAFIADLDVDQV